MLRQTQLAKYAYSCARHLFLYRVFNRLAGFGFGASAVGMFARVGSGVFTKAAGVGTDLVGKAERGFSVAADFPTQQQRVPHSVDSCRTKQERIAVVIIWCPWCTGAMLVAGGMHSEAGGFAPDEGERTQSSHRLRRDQQSVGCSSARNCHPYVCNITFNCLLSY